MIFGNVNNEFFEQQTAILPAPLKSALCFLKETDLAAHEPGRFDIELGGVPMVLQVLDLTTAPRQTLRRTPCRFPPPLRLLLLTITTCVPFSLKSLPVCFLLKGYHLLISFPIPHF